MALLEIEKTIEAYLGEVTKAVIWILACFNSDQLQAMINADEVAGLNALSIISEPTSAAPSYGLYKRTGMQWNVLTSNSDGGTFDVAMWGKKIWGKGSSGDFDSWLMD